jgi:hypothetical protein
MMFGRPGRHTKACEITNKIRVDVDHEGAISRL